MRIFLALLLALAFSVQAQNARINERPVGGTSSLNSGTTRLTGCDGAIPYGASSVLTCDTTNLLYDATNKRIQVGSGSTTSAGIYAGYAGSSGYAGLFATSVTPSTAANGILLSSTEVYITANDFNIVATTGGALKFRQLNTAGLGPAITAGTATTDVQAISATQTWNGAGVTFRGELLNITNTASAAGSRFVEYQRGGTLQYGVTSGATSTGLQIRTAQQTAPTCSASCGTSPSVSGSDTAMTVTMGATGVPASGFVITFNGTWATAPACTGAMALAGMAVGKLPMVIATTTTTITVTTNGTAPANSDKYHFICVGIS